MKEYSPANETERNLVNQLATTLWRLHRIPSFEQAVITYKKHYLERQQRDHPNRVIEEHNAKSWNAHNLRKCLPEPGYVDPANQGTLLEWGRTLLEIISEGDILSKVARHEAHLSRRLDRILDRLEKLRRERQAIQLAATQQAIARPETQQLGNRAGPGKAPITNAKGQTNVN